MAERRAGNVQLARLTPALQVIQRLWVVGQDPLLGLLSETGHLAEHGDGVELAYGSVWPSREAALGMWGCSVAACLSIYLFCATLVVLNVGKGPRMATEEQGQATVLHTERGLTIAGTRITLYDVLDYLHAGWPPKLIRDRLDLTDQQVADALAYINTYRAEVEAEYQEVRQTAQEIRQYWEEQSRARSAQIASPPPKPGQEALREKLQAWKAKLKSMS